MKCNSSDVARGAAALGLPLGASVVRNEVFDPGAPDGLMAITGSADRAAPAGGIIMPAQAQRRLPLKHMSRTEVLTALAPATTQVGCSWKLKRIIDIAGGCIGLAVSSPLLPILALGVWLDVGWPVLYAQDRLGKAGSRFRIVKFRTLRGSVGRQRRQLESHAAGSGVSRFGRFLRRSHLDELPQLWNVVRGEMSLVGPRPEWTECYAGLARRIPLYEERLLVRPGLTGWAQVNCGYAESIAESRAKLEYDLYYLKHRSLRLDAEIVWRTIWEVLRLRGR